MNQTINPTNCVVNTAKTMSLNAAQGGTSGMASSTVQFGESSLSCSFYGIGSYIRPPEISSALALSTTYNVVPGPPCRLERYSAPSASSDSSSRHDQGNKLIYVNIEYFAGFSECCCMQQITGIWMTALIYLWFLLNCSCVIWE